MRVGTVTFGLIAAFLIVFFLGIPIHSQATVFFADGFEYASQGAFEAVWATSCPGISTLMGPSAEFAVSPTRSLRTFHDGGLSSCFIDRSFPQTTRVFYRMNFRMADGFDLESICNPSGSCPGGNGSKLIYAKAVGANYNIFAHLQPGNREIRLNAPHGGFTVLCPTSGVYDQECLFYPNRASIPIQPGNTYCIEMELVRNTPGASDGVGRIWVNGTLTLEYTNIAMANSNEGNTGFNDVTYYSQAGYGIRYLDDLAVGNTRIGCGVTPPPSSVDIVAPSAPSGLLLH